MASCRRSKTTSETRKDIITQLPEEVKEKILDGLPTRDAARTALLSSEWKDVWLRHGRLAFDTHFFECVKKCQGDKRVALVSIINDILLHRAGPVKKFILDITRSKDPKPDQSDLDRWCRFLSRNGVEELNITVYGKEYKLPSSIVTCRTIKQLKLKGFLFDYSVNAGRIFSGVTSLVFENVEFKSCVNGIVSNLEKMALYHCIGTNNFKIYAPKLKSLFGILYVHTFESTWFTLVLKGIKTLYLNGHLLSCDGVAVVAPTFPIARNLKVITLYDLDFRCGKQITVALQLLEKSPNLCGLEIVATNSLSRLSWRVDKDAASRLIMKDDSDGCLINKDLKMLKIIKIEVFSGSTLEMLFCESSALKVS